MNKSLLIVAALAVACTSNKGDSADSAASDTDDTASGDAVYGCSVADWGICYDHYTVDGWDQASATESCDFLASQYGVSTTFIANPGCPTDSAVGECDLPAGGDFSFAVSALYDSGDFDSATGQAACDAAGGTYYGF